MKKVFAVNLWGVIHGTKAFLPHLLASGDGHVVNISSLNGYLAQGGMSHYCTSKFAVRGFTESLRHELENTNISVGAIYPAGVKTGIILHGRYAAAIDPAVADRAAAAQAAMYHTEPADAASRIVEATVRRRARTMIGREARLVDVLSRVTPTNYWKSMRRPLRAAIDTTTPID